VRNRGIKGVRKTVTLEGNVVKRGEIVAHSAVRPIKMEGSFGLKFSQQPSQMWDQDDRL